MEQVLSEHISRHMREMVTGSSQHKFTQGKSCLTNLISFRNKITGFLDDGRIKKLYQGLDSVSHNILVSILEHCSLGSQLDV